MKILSCFVSFAVFVAIFISGWSLDHTIVTARSFLPQGTIRPPTTTERDETGSYVLTNCENELVEIKKGIGYFDLYFQEDAAPSLQDLNSYLQSVFQDCLSNNGLPDLAEDHSIDKYFDFSPRSRRLSADDPLGGPESTSSSSERSLGPNNSPSQPGEKSAKGHRTHKRKVTRNGKLTSSKVHQLEYERKTSSDGGSSSNGIQIMNLEAIPPEDVPKKQQNLIAPIVAAAGSTIFIIAVVVLFCARRHRSKRGPKDEKPLLTEIKSQILDYSKTREKGKDGSSFRSDGTHESLPENDLEAPAGSGALPPPPRRAPPPPPPPPPQASGPPPPPPPKGSAPPAPPPRGGQVPAPPNAKPGSSLSGNAGAVNSGVHRTKLKPFFWDKVLATPEHAMVWDEIRAGSFQFNEEMIETLFGYNPDAKKNNDRRGRNVNSATPLIQIIDSRKAQNLAILLKALNVTTEEVKDALLEGTELPAELLQTLLKMQPTTEEEVKLRLYSGDLSQIGSAERFLKVMVEIPFAFKRMECMLFMMTLKEEVSGLKDSFTTLEVASKTLRSSRLFLKLLEAVLKTGNRMNDGTYRGGAQAFKLDTLLKLSDVKGKDGKTTLLHFVVQEIIRTEGIKVARRRKRSSSASNIKSDDLIEDPMVDPSDIYRSLGLQVLSGLSTELAVVKKAAIIDSDTLVSTVSKLGQSLLKTKDFLNKEMQDLGEESRFYLVLKDFVEDSEEEVKWLIEEERRIMAIVKKTVDYFHGNSSKDEGLRLFVIVRDFLILLDRICGEIKMKMEQAAKPTRKETSTRASPQNSPSPSRASSDASQKLFPALSDNNSSDRDSSSDSESRTSSTKENSAVEPNTHQDSRRQTSGLKQTIKEPSQDRQSEECSNSSSSDKESDMDKDSKTCTKESLGGSEQLKKTPSQEKVMEQMRQKLFPVIQDKSFDDYTSSSDDEN